MKYKIVFTSIFCMCVFCVNAQSDYSSYLNKALEKLEAGDCEAGRKFYNVYKELSGKSVFSVEDLLSDCNRSKGYKLGDIIQVGDIKYTVVYIRDNGQHGYAVLDQGWDYMNRDQIRRKDIPTLDEMKKIYINKDAVRMYDIYWTSTVFVSKDYKESAEHYYYMDFSTGIIAERYFLNNKNTAKVLLIHRF